MSALGQKGTSDAVSAVSALPLKADIVWRMLEILLIQRPLVHFEIPDGHRNNSHRNKPSYLSPCHWTLFRNPPVEIGYLTGQYSLYMEHRQEGRRQWTSLGGVLLAVAVAMLVVGRGGRDGEPRAFLSNWLISTIYSVAILIIFVAGAGVILLNWPF